MFLKKNQKKSRKKIFFGQKPRKILTKKKIIFSIFLLSFVGQKFLGNRQIHEKMIKMDKKNHLEHVPYP